MRILITGASGFTGRHACDFFSKVGYQVTAVSRKSQINTKNINSKCCDLTDQFAVYKLVKDTNPSYLLHLAGQNHVGESWENPLTSIHDNMTSTANLVEAVRNTTPQCKLIVTGSALQFNPSRIESLQHPYSLSKTFQVLLAQAWQQLYKMNIIIAKPSNIIGPGPSNGVCSLFAKKIAQMESGEFDSVLDVNNLHVQRDFVDVRDVVRGYELLFQKGKKGAIYDIASGSSQSLKEIVVHLKELANVNFTVKTKGEQVKEEPKVISVEKIKGLGWERKIILKRSLADTLNYWRKETITNLRERM